MRAGVVFGGRVVVIGNGTDQNLDGSAAQGVPVGLMAGESAHVLATSAEHAHVLRHTDGPLEANSYSR